MILQRPDGSYAFVPMTGATLGQQCISVTMTAADVHYLLELDPQAIKDWLATSLLTRFVPYDLKTEYLNQRREVERQNRLLKGSEAIDNFDPPQFRADRDWRP